MDEQRLDDQLGPIYNNSVLEAMPGVMDNKDEWRERETGKSVLAARHVDVDASQAP